MDASETAKIILEQATGAVMAVALVFHVLETKGVLKHQDVADAIRGASDMIPDAKAAEPQYRALAVLRVMLEDPTAPIAPPFPWPPRAKH